SGRPSRWVWWARGCDRLATVVSGGVCVGSSQVRGATEGTPLTGLSSLRRCVCAAKGSLQDDRVWGGMVLLVSRLAQKCHRCYDETKKTAAEKFLHVHTSPHPWNTLRELERTRDSTIHCGQAIVPSVLSVQLHWVETPTRQSAIPWQIMAWWRTGDNTSSVDGE